MPNRQIIDIGVSGASFDVNLGRICDGDTIDLQFCNSDGAHTYSFSCTCPAFSGLPASEAFSVCQCRTYTLTYAGDGVPGIGSCTIIVSRSGGNTMRVNLTWEEVYCELNTTAWSLTDESEVVEINNGNFNADCDVFYGSCMANRHTLNITHALAQPLAVGDVVYFSQWLCAQIVNWDYQDFPLAGWKYRVCLGEEESVDGSFEMEWYGEQPSEENSADTPYVTCTISNSGTDVSISITFNLLADTITAPSNIGVNNHDALLKNALRNNFILDNASENSVYRNPKYMTWATVVYRAIGAIYQDAIFSIKAELPFYNEPSVTTSPMRLTLNSVTLTRAATGTDTNYLSTTRPTTVLVDFDYISSDPSGTVPTAMWVYMIRNDAQNNQLDYYENYEYEQADLTTLSPSASITPTVAPVNVSGDNFTAEFDVSVLHPELEGVNGVNLTYRFIFVAISTTDQEARSVITPQPIALINYDDEAMPLNTLDVVWRTVEQEYIGTVQTLQDIPVNMDVETALRLDLAATNAELSAKTSGQVNDARKALTAIKLDVYEENPLTGNLLLDTMFFQPEIRNTCNELIESDDLISQSSGSNVEVTFPFTIPDNIYRSIGREGLFQRVDGQFQRVPVVDASLDCVIATQVNQCNFGQSFGIMQSGVTGARYRGEVQYIPTTQEIWSLDIDNSEVHIFDANTFTFSAAVVLPSGYNPQFSQYCPANNCVYLSSNSTISTVVSISITSRTIVATIPIGTVGDLLRGLKYIPQTQELIVANFTTNEIERIDINTNTVVGAPIALGTGSGARQIEFIPAINEIWVTCNSTATVERVNYTTFTHVGSIATTGANAIKLVGNEVWVGGGSSIEIIDVNTLAIIQTIATTFLTSFFTEFGGVIYIGDGISNIYGYDTQSYNQVTNLFVGTNTFPLFVLLANGILYVTNQQPVDTIYLFDADCQQQLPPFSMMNRNILFDWQLEFDIFDNKEIYHAFQKIERPQSPLFTGKFTPDDFIDDIVVEYPDDITPTPLPIDNATPCATTGTINVNAKWGNNASNRELFGVALEFMPVRGGMVSPESSQPVAGNIIIPINSPYIKNLSPQFGVNADINFDIDYPNLPIDGDYEIYIHFLIRP